MQKQTRVEKEFIALEMGRLPHSAFLAEWERFLLELEEAGVTISDADTLFRRYLQKLSGDLRSIILTRTWLLGPEGVNSAPRKPVTWEECIERVSQ